VPARGQKESYWRGDRCLRAVEPCRRPGGIAFHAIAIAPFRRCVPLILSALHRHRRDIGVRRSGASLPPFRAQTRRPATGRREETCCARIAQSRGYHRALGLQALPEKQLSALPSRDVSFVARPGDGFHSRFGRGVRRSGRRVPCLVGRRWRRPAGERAARLGLEVEDRCRQPLGLFLPRVHGDERADYELGQSGFDVVTDERAQTVRTNGEHRERVDVRSLRRPAVELLGSGAPAGVRDAQPEVLRVDLAPGSLRGRLDPFACENASVGVSCAPTHPSATRPTHSRAFGRGSRRYTCSHARCLTTPREHEPSRCRPPNPEQVARRLRSGSAPGRAARAAHPVAPVTGPRVPLKPAHPAAPPSPEVRPCPSREGIEPRVPLRMPLAEQFGVSHRDRSLPRHPPTADTGRELRCMTLPASRTSVAALRSVFDGYSPPVTTPPAAPPDPPLRRMPGRPRV
jgi:hypothetical protein